MVHKPGRIFQSLGIRISVPALHLDPQAQCGSLAHHIAVHLALEYVYAERISFNIIRFRRGAPAL